MAKTKALISFAVTAKLICVFVFAYARSRFSHDAAHLWLRMPTNARRTKILYYDIYEKFVFIFYECELQDQNQGFYGLYLIQAQYEHYGTYECTAMTTLHSDSRSAMLTVTGMYSFLQL